MLPFFLRVDAAAARRILLYRRATLDAARRRARELGYQGACFAWESSVTGEDVTPRAVVLKSSGQEIPVLTGAQQVHITADVAYGVWRYWEATGDESFMADAGAAILCETARFWASRIERGDRQHHIRGVMGPDEYHADVDDNAYTNYMARFNLERAAWAAQRYGRNGPEFSEWLELASTLYCARPRSNGVIEQFSGFFELEDMSAIERDDSSQNSRLSDWRRLNRLKLLKQPDVLMLPLLFPDLFSDEIVAANYRYYEPITEHGSSLSAPVHAAIAARIGLKDEAQRHWQRALHLDLSDPARSRLGVHTGCMGGTWLALERFRGTAAQAGCIAGIP